MTCCFTAENQKKKKQRQNIRIIIKTESIIANNSKVAFLVYDIVR